MGNCDRGRRFGSWHQSIQSARCRGQQNRYPRADHRIWEEDGLKLFTDEQNAEALKKAAGSNNSLAGILRAHLNRLSPGDYFALLAYVQMNQEHEDILQSVRHAIRDRKRVATCLGFGPRFLHSTGQAYKGGPNSGVFLQITCDDAADLAVPGQK